MFIRIQYLSQRGMVGYENQYVDSYVMEVGNVTIEFAVKMLLERGFTRKSNERQRYDDQRYDEAQVIMPGAILTVVECDKHGYSKSDRAEIARRKAEEEDDARRRPKDWLG
jgi:hypothetical protein